MTLANLPLTLALSLILSACSSRPTAPATTANCVAPEPEQVAQAFYDRQLQSPTAGLPSTASLNAWQPYLSTSLLQALKQARADQQAFILTHPNEKPDLIDGQLWSSLFEGHTSAQVLAEPNKQNPLQRIVTVDFSHADLPGFTWQDQLLLIQEQGCWRLDDVRYQGQWPFAQQGSLRQQLSPKAEASQ